MSEAESSQHSVSPDDFSMVSDRGPTSYICVDENPESLTTNSAEVDEDWNGGFLYPVTVACSGRGNIYNCPPYRSDSSALSCVVCSKYYHIRLFKNKTDHEELTQKLSPTHDSSTIPKI